MKSRKTFHRAGALGGALGLAAVLSGLVVTRLLPPWVPFSWRPCSRSEARQPLA